MMTDDDRRELGDLAIRALDSIADYGDDATLTAAILVLEVRHTDDEGRDIFSCEYKSLDRNSPHHLAGVMQSTINWLTAPECGQCDPSEDGGGEQ
jgi:hypothetical protein